MNSETFSTSLTDFAPGLREENPQNSSHYQTPHHNADCKTEDKKRRHVKIPNEDFGVGIQFTRNRYQTHLVSARTHGFSLNESRQNALNNARGNQQTHSGGHAAHRAHNGATDNADT